VRPRPVTNLGLIAVSLGFGPPPAILLLTHQIRPAENGLYVFEGEDEDGVWVFEGEDEDGVWWLRRHDPDSEKENGIYHVGRVIHGNVTFRGDGDRK
jgi:hypothetical protein